MGDNFGEWMSLFSASEHNIFDIIENAIKIAATDFPSEFKAKRDRITEMLFSGKNTKSIENCENLELKKNVNECLMSNGDESICTTEDSKLMDEMLKVKAILDKGLEQSDDLIIESLKKLQGMNKTFGVLYDTKIGFSVAIYKKHESHDIKTLAKSLIRDRRNFVYELEACNPEVIQQHVKASAAAEEEKKLISHPSKNENALHPIKKIQTNEEDDSLRSKLEIAKRKLHERYEECENAKRQRTIKVLELKDLPKQTTEKSRKLSNCGRNLTSGKKQQGYCFQRKCF